MITDREALVQQLKEFGITNAMVAELAGVTQGCIGHQLVGRRPLTNAVLVAANELINRRPLYLLATANKLIAEACRLAEIQGRDIITEFAATDRGSEIMGVKHD